MSNVACVVGTQWGDEGKGKITDWLAQNADVVVRYQGGNNAGHTIVFNGEKYALHLIPSGIFDESTVNVLANGMVINLEALKAELDYLHEKGFNNFKLKISDRAHIVLPYHIDLDKHYEKLKGSKSVGTTAKGIGPAYTDKAARIGIRIAELFDDGLLREKLELNLLFKQDLLNSYGTKYSVDELFNYLKSFVPYIKDYVCDTSKYLFDMHAANKKILFEGAQGIMLCIDHGTYPFVTSSSPTASSIPLNAGVNVNMIDKVVGVCKAYSTRVGSGAFPTEFEDEVAKNIREVGREYGTTTGRPRRIGWFDSVVVRHAVRVGSVNKLSIMLLDVLSGVKELKICTHYILNGEKIDTVPANISDFEKCIPVYETVPGFDDDITSVTSFEMLPENAKNYLKRIEELCGAKIAIFSVGPDRMQTIMIERIL